MKEKVSLRLSAAALMRLSASLPLGPVLAPNKIDIVWEPDAELGPDPIALLTQDNER